MRSFALIFTSTALAGALLGGCADGMFGKSSTATPSNAAQQAAAERQPSAEVRDVQQRLKQLGYYDGTVDGLWGPDTQVAVQKYQRERGLTVSSALDDDTRAALRRETGQDRTAQRSMENRSTAPGTSSPGTSSSTGSGTAGQQAGATTQGEYIGRQQVGQNSSSQTRTGTSTQNEARRMQDISPAAGPGAGAHAVSPRNLSQANVRDVQQKLADEGQYRASVDGVWGPRSQKALINFQTQNGLRADGVIGPRTAHALGLDLKQLSANTGTRGMGGGGLDSGSSTGSGSGALSPGSTSPGSTGPGSTSPGSTNGNSGSMSPGNTGGATTSPGGTGGSGSGPAGGSPQQ